MPEKPKRRKNKNKRKNNKNPSINKNNTDESEITIDETSVKDTDKESVTIVEGQQIEISATSETSSTLDPTCKTDASEVIEKAKEEHEVISSTSQICVESNQAIDDINPELESHKVLNKDILITSQGDPIPNENCGTEETNKEKKNNTIVSSEVCALSEQSLSNDKNITKQSEEILEKYIVETPEQVTKVKCKLDNGMKSKSCDSDDCPIIVEITDDPNLQSDNDHTLSVVDNSNVIISGEDVEWEKVDHFNLPQTELIKGILSSDTIPLNIVHSEQIKSLSPQEELSLRNYLQTLNLSTNPSNLNTGDIKTEIEQIINREIKYRLRKKGLTEDNLFPRAGPSRSLAVIDEEGSGDSSKTSRRHSYLSDKKSDNEELEDDVFESKSKQPLKTSQTDFLTSNLNKRLIPQPCIRVDAKLKEPDVSEARGDWSMKVVEQMTGAELVYLTDSSSSTSSIYDINDDVDKGEETDVSVRMITPTIEVTDTEALLSNTFLSNNNNSDKSKSSEYACKIDNKSDNSLEDNKAESNDLNKKVIESNSQRDAHEIVILRTDNIKTNLFVKDVNNSKFASETDKLPKSNIELENKFEKFPESSSKSPKEVDLYDLEIKVLKCELNDAINNLIKEVISDSDINKESSKDTLTRQDSSSSLDSSQCTAKYNPTNSSLNDVSNILQDHAYDNTKESPQRSLISTTSHVKDILQHVVSESSFITRNIEDECSKQPSKLRDICLQKITSFPYGDKILEELANVSLRLQNMSALASERSQLGKSQTTIKGCPINVDQMELNKNPDYKTLNYNNNTSIPPPILPRKSSLKMAQDEPIKFVAPKTEVLYECLSPSQKMLMEKTNTTIKKDSKSQPDLNNIHSKISDKSENKIYQFSTSTSMAPMKSETGSRLLALLQDTSISKNLNTKSLEEQNLRQVPKTKPPHSDTFSKRLLDEIDSTQYFKESTSDRKTTTTTSNYSLTPSNNFRPIPPPKPKKLSTYCYESDENSDFRENSFQTMHSNKKYFHYSTGNLSKEIENDISSIQNMHRYCTNLRDQTHETSPRRPSLPKDLCDQQMEYIRQKEKEVDAELRRLEQEKNKANKSRGPRAPMVSEEKNNCNKIFDSQSKSYVNKDFTSMFQTSKNIENSKLSSLFSSSQEELLREKMYSEYVNQMAEREQRKQQRVIKVTQTPVNSSIISKSMPLLENFDSKMNNRIEEEFISKARERWYKLGIRDPETEDENDIGGDLYKEPKVIEHRIKVIEAGEEKDVKKLPSHMQEFVKFTVKDKEEGIGSTGESNSEKASAHVVFCAVVILVLTVGKFLLQLLRNK